MRIADLLGLAVAALVRRKARTALTLLGVVCGGFVLVVSLSVGQGVQETIVREVARHSDLRLMQVRPVYDEAGEGGGEDVQAMGEMSDDRRGRLTAELKRRRLWQTPTLPKTPLTRDRVRQLEGMEHVRSVTPLLRSMARTALGKKAENAFLAAAQPDDAHYRSRVVAGDFFDAPDGRGVLVSEWLLYQLGVADEAGAREAVGRTLRLEFRGGGGGRFGMLMALLNPGGRADTVDEEDLLNKVVARLPEALEKLDLKPEEAKALKGLIRRAPERPLAPPEPDVVEEYTICGVLRAVSEEEAKDIWDYDRMQTDVLLPPRTAADLLDRLPLTAQNGYDAVAVEVDAVDHVKGVTEQVRGRGLAADAPLDAVEVERFIYFMVFTGMTLVAAVALLVAALGITNTMLIGVLERVREIGVMKAVGARDGHIQLMFLVEGALIGLAGGVLGLLLAWALSGPGDGWMRSVLARNTSIKLEQSVFVFPLWLVLGAPAFACLTTTLAAVYPARRASRVDPVQALRHE